ncbi:MAG: hypothetical protein V3T83_01405, partial [Acidobacteriota bacterium]
MVDDPKTVLFVSSSSEGLRIDSEIQSIQNQLNRYRPQKQQIIKFATCLASTASGLRRALTDYKPYILHFSGHGAGRKGIFLEHEDGTRRVLPTSLLADLCSYFSEYVKCVVLNACFTTYQAYEIVRHIDYVIGMRQAISDPIAISYSAAFYDSLAAGENVPNAHRLACWDLQANYPEKIAPERVRENAIAVSDIPNSVLVHDNPVLVVRDPGDEVPHVHQTPTSLSHISDYSLATLKKLCE